MSTALFTPFTINQLELPNRIVMAPMTRNFCPDNITGDDVAAYYRRRAEGGTGLIITEGTTLIIPRREPMKMCRFSTVSKPWRAGQRLSTKFTLAEQKLHPSYGTPALCAVSVVRAQVSSRIPIRQPLVPLAC